LFEADCPQVPLKVLSPRFDLSDVDDRQELDECVTSVLDMDLDDLEVKLVDDELDGIIPPPRIWKPMD
jgi:hypothetical protein